MESENDLHDATLSIAKAALSRQVSPDESAQAAHAASSLQAALEANERFQALAEAFDLMPADLLIVSLAFHAHISIEVAESMEALNAEHGRHSLSRLALARITGLTETMESPLLARLAPDAPLRAHAIIELAPAQDGLLAPIVLSESVFYFLLGRPWRVARIDLYVRRNAETPEIYVDEETELEIRDTGRLLNVRAPGLPGVTATVFGKKSGQLREVALHAIAASKRDSLEVDLTALLVYAQNPAEVSRALARIFREAHIQNAVVSLLNEPPGDGLFAVEDGIREAFALYPISLIFTGCELLERRLRKNFRYLHQIIQPIGYAVRLRVWREMLAKSGAELPPGYTPEILAGRYLFEPDQIIGAVLSAAPGVQDGVIRRDRLIDACRRQAAHNLDALATKTERPYAWEDIVLTSKARLALNDVVAHMRRQEAVHADWDYAGKIPGRGLHALFAGPSGTGKTMAASVIANELGLELYRIDLARIVSKYIGETEKNLSRIFDGARASNAILFFDEADALFGKRSEVKDARDRYANIEVAYLLQKMEDYEGMTILATNLDANIDDAFLRRLHFIVYFSPPDRRERKAVWEKAFPAKAPLGRVDFDWLGRTMEMTPAMIQNVAYHAAVFALEEADGDAASASIEMKHIMKASFNEYEKEGRPFVEGAMQPYFSLAFE